MAELEGELQRLIGGLVVKIDTLILKFDDITDKMEDFEKRLSSTEKWQAKSAGMLLVVSASVAVLSAVFSRVDFTKLAAVFH